MPIPKVLADLLKRRGFADSQVEDFKCLYENMPKPVQLVANGVLIALAHTGQVVGVGQPEKPATQLDLPRVLMGVTRDLALWKYFHGIETHLLYYSIKISETFRTKTGMDGISNVSSRIRDAFRAVQAARQIEGTFSDLAEALIENAYRPLLRGIVGDSSTDEATALSLERLKRLEYRAYAPWQIDLRKVVKAINARAKDMSNMLDSPDNEEGWVLSAHKFVGSHKIALVKALEFMSAILMANSFMALSVGHPASIPLEDSNRRLFAEYVADKTSADSCRGLVTAANNLLFSWIEILTSQ